MVLLLLLLPDLSHRPGFHQLSLFFLQISSSPQTLVHLREFCAALFGVLFLGKCLLVVQTAEFSLTLGEVVFLVQNGAALALRVVLESVAAELELDL